MGHPWAQTSSTEHVAGRYQEYGGVRGVLLIYESQLQFNDEHAITITNCSTHSLEKYRERSLLKTF